MIYFFHTSHGKVRRLSVQYQDGFFYVCGRMKEIIVTGEQNIIDIYVYALGWVNLSQKLEIEKNTVCGKVISSKKLVRNLFTLFFAQIACGFAWNCKFLQSSCSPHFLSCAV